MMNKIDQIIENTQQTNPQQKSKEEHGQTVIQVVQIHSKKQTPKDTPPLSNQPSKVKTPPQSGIRKQSGQIKQTNANTIENNKQSLTLKNQSQLKTVSRLQKVRSSTKLGRQSMISQQKRMRLKQYLYTARQSLQKNRERRQELKRNSPPGSQMQVKNSLIQLKRNKYQISNEQMHKIVRKGVQNQIKQIIQTLESQLTFVQNQDMSKVSKQDLQYFYDVRVIVGQKIFPAVEEMRNLNFNRQQTLLQGILNIGKDLVQEKDMYIDQKIPMTKTISKQPDSKLIQSIFMKKKQ